MKRFLSLLLTASMLISAAANIFVGAEEVSENAVVDVGSDVAMLVSESDKTGECGENLTWSLDDNGKLTIAGTGEMYSYAWGSLPWYEYRDSITEVVIEDGVTSISRYAFNNCVNIVKATVPKSVKEIGIYAFDARKYLTITGYNGTVAEIFAKARGIAFSCLDTDTKAVYAEGTMGENFSWKLYDTSELVISGSGYMPEEYAYDALPWYDSYEDYIGEITIEDGIKSIIYGVISYCVHLRKITIPASVEFIDDTLRNADNAEVVGYDGTVAEIAAKAAGVTFTALDTDVDNVFASGTVGDNIKWTLYDYATLVIEGSGVLGEEYYYESPWSPNNSFIRKVEMPEGITKIGDNVFDDHEFLVEITLPSTLTEIASNAFYSCESLEEIVIPNSVTAIGRYAFAYCRELTEMNIPASVTSIGDYAFNGCYNMTAFTVDSENKNYMSEDGVIFDKAQTQLVCYPAKGTTAEYSIPETVTSISSAAFNNNSSIEVLNINAALRSVGNVYQCNQLKQINVDEGSIYYSADENGVLFNKDKTTLVLYPARKTLEEYTVPDSVTSIDIYAFQNANYVNKVIIPKSVNSIDQYAFSRYRNYTICAYNGSYAELYANANNIAFEALDENTVAIVDEGTCGSSVKWAINDLGELTISGTGAMTNYTRSSSAPWYSYEGLISKVTVEDGVTTIGDYAFYNYQTLTDVTIADSVTSIGAYAFSYVDGLESITFPVNLKTIGNYAFASCYYLTGITIPNGVTTIGDSAFSGCSQMREFSVPASVTSIGSLAFNCYRLTAINVDADNKAYSSIDGVLFNKDQTKIITYPAYKTGEEYAIPETVTEIPERTFYDLGNLVSVTVPESVTKIDRNNFYSCDKLTSVTVYAREPEIGDYVFMYNDSDDFTVTAYDGSTIEFYVKSKGINFIAIDGDKVNTIAEGVCGDAVTWKLDETGKLTVSGTGEMYDYESADQTPWYEYQKNISAVLIESGVTNVGRYAFYGCSNLKEVVISEGVTFIEFYAFRECYNLTSVTLPETLTTLDNAPFEYCGSLESITLPKNLNYIGDYAFRGTSLKSIVIPEAVTYIGIHGFMDTDLTSVTIPAGTELGDYVFMYCYYLTEINVDANNPYHTSENGVLFNKDKTTLICYPAGKADKEYQVPDGVTTLKERAFLSNQNLVTLKLPEGLTTIEREVFQSCAALQSVTVPESVTAINEYNFRYCESLTDVTIYSRDAVFGSNCFVNSSADLTVTAYDGSTAEFYAKEKNVNFYAIDGDKVNTIAQGTCGDALTWTLDDTGLLQISGTGAMYDFGNGSAPWSSYSGTVKSVVIDEGVTSIGQFAFAYCEMTTVSIPTTVTSIGYSAFSWCRSLEALVIPEGVTSISHYAINDCDAIKTIELPSTLTEFHILQICACDGIESITVSEDNQFIASVDGSVYSKDMTTLYYYPQSKADAEFTIPNTVTTISASAFEGKKYLKNVTVPASVTVIGEKNFYYCEALENVTVLGMETEIGDNCFRYYYGDHVTVTAYDGSDAEFYAKKYDDYTAFVAIDGDKPNVIASGECGEGLTWTLDNDGLLAISGTGAMTEYTSYNDVPWYSYSDVIDSIVVGDGATSVGAYAFYSCYNVESAILPEGITSIGNYAFHYNGVLESITLPSTLVSIGNYAFQSCYNLTSINIPASVETIGEGAFAYGNLAAITVDGNNANYSSEDGVLFNKDKTVLLLYPQDKQDTEYTIPDTVTEIGDEIFYSNDTLVSVTIPESVVKIGRSNFTYCWSLKDVTIYARTTEFGYYCFEDCADGFTVTAYDGSTAEFYAKDKDVNFIAIDGDKPNVIASGECGEGLTWSLMDSGVLTISGTGAMADYGSSNAPWYSIRDKIKEVVVEEGVTTVSRYAFYSCYNLQTVTLPEGLTSIDYAAFAYTKITSIDIPDGVTTVGSEAFGSCSNLKSVTIPETVESIGNSAFNYCYALESITVDKNNAYYTSANGVLYNKDMTELILYPGAKTSTQFTVPDTVQTIANRAVSQNPYLTYVTIPASVTQIYSYNFQNCSNLSIVTIYSMDASIAYGSFRDGNSELRLYGYTGSTAETYANNYSITFISLNSGEEAESSNVVIKVVDSSTEAALTNAMVSVTNVTGTVDEQLSVNNSGEVSLELSEGTYTVQAVVPGYEVRSVTVAVTTEKNAFTIYMSQASIMEVETSVEEITLDEAMEAGIDVSSAANEQIYECTAVFEFGPIVYYCDGDEVISDSVFYFDDTSVYVIAKDVYLLVHSEVTWLKEMFDVELLVSNTSAVEVLENCSVELDLPTGLSLAVMNESVGQQSEAVELGNIAPQTQTTHHWYICGDEAGEYTIDGTVSATRTGGGVSEDMEVAFTTKDPIVVLGGEAMKLTITAENLAEVGTPYTLQYTLENVSDKTLYNVALNVLGGKFYDDYLVSGVDYYPTAEDAPELEGTFNDGYSLTDEEFMPGEQLTGTFEIVFGVGIETNYIHYMLYNAFTITGKGSTVEVPTEIILVDEISIHSWGNRLNLSEPTCTTEGMDQYTCTDEGCGEIITVVIPALGHDFETTRTLDKAATCTEDGQSSFHCTSGDALKDILVLPALGHIFGDWTINREATCSLKGEQEHTCERCKIVEFEDIPKVPHAFATEWTVDKEATCTTDGEKSYHCADCEARSEITVINALGHDHAEEFTVDIQETCTTDGQKSRHCSRCDDKADVTVIPKLGHSFGEWYETKAATCTTDGEQRHDCIRCDVFETEVLPALGHDHAEEFTVDIKETCTTDGEKSRHCSRCEDRIEITVIPMLGHSFDEWTTVAATCTEDGKNYRTCQTCGLVETEVLPALGHDFADEWTIAKEVTCTEDGLKYYACSRCDARKDETVIEAVGHVMTEWLILESATIYKTGSRTRYCANCDYTETEVVDKLYVDPNDPDYGIAYFTVVNAETLEPIANAGIYISTSDGDECTLVTDSSGKAAHVLPIGKQTVSIYADGYMTRNVNITICGGEQNIPTIGISTRELVEAKVNATEMTYDEIVAAGIDVTNPANQHVVKYEIDIRFKADFDWASIFAYFNLNGDFLGCGSPINDDDDDPDGGEFNIGWGDIVDYDSGTGRGRGVRFDFGNGETATVYPVDEYFYLIIYGEARWLKEMYDVEMLIINHSMTDTLENCTASLTLPEGLSLAAMVNGAQSLSQTIDTVGYGETKSVHWYVRGDEAGSYNVTARLRGVMQPFGEVIDREYVSENSIHVYAGNALHMNIYLPRYTYYGDNYNVRIELTNVSGKTLYNVSNAITGVKEGQVTYYSDGTVKDEVLFSAGMQDYAFDSAFKPGDKLVVETTVPILFQSEMMEYKKGELISAIDRIESMVGQYNKFTTAVTTMSSAIKNTASVFNGFRASITNLDAKKDNAIRLLSDAMTNFATKFNSGNKKAVEVIEALNSIGKLAELRKLKDNPELLLDLSINDIKELTDLFKLLDNEEEPEPFNIYDSLRTFVESLPVSYYVTNVFVTTLAGSTTSIPYSVIMDNSYEVQYFGVDNMGKYMFSLASAAFGEIDVPWYLNMLGVEDDPTGYNDAVEYIRMQEAQMEAVAATDTTETKEFKVWSEPTASTYSMRSAASAFTFSCNNETAVYEDGVLTFTGSGVIEITANGTAGGTVYVSADGEIVKTFVVEIVETHTCTSDTWVTEIAPTEEYDGLAAKYCDVCGELAGTMAVELCGSHTFGDEIIAAENGISLSYRECSVCGYHDYTIDESANDVVIAGDIDDSGDVDEIDSDLLARYFAGWDVEDQIYNIDAADFNGDGKVTRADAMILARYLAGWEGYEKYFE